MKTPQLQHKDEINLSVNVKNDLLYDNQQPSSELGEGSETIPVMGSSKEICEIADKFIRIYALVDPRDDRVRYVGKTIRTLEQRLYFHFYSLRREKNKRCSWMKSLLKQDLKPNIILLEEFPYRKDWFDREIYWIAYYRSLFSDLLNMTDGGDGNNNQVFSKEAIEKRAARLRGVPCKEETKLKIAKAHKGKRNSEIHNYNTREGIIKLQGRPILQFTKDNIFIKEWRCTTDACKDLKLGTDYRHAASGISAVLRKLKHTAYGYIWKYKFEDIVQSTKKLDGSNEVT